MTKTLFTCKQLCVLTVSMCLLSCGGGGDFVGIDGSGAKPETAVTGPINGFGSVIVNGTRFNTDTAQFYVRGKPASESQLRVGNYVTVIGKTGANGQSVAAQIFYEPNVSGMVENVDAQTDIITVLGQKIKLDDTTIFGPQISPRNIMGIQAGMHVSVSGSATSSSGMRASRIDVVDNQFAELSGSIRELNSTDRTFVIGFTVIDYSNAIGAEDLKDHQYVLVFGTPDGNKISANEVVILESQRRQVSFHYAEVSGQIFDFIKEEGRFSIDGFSVTFNERTNISGGLQEDISNDVNVSVEGEVQAGTIAAEHIRIMHKPTLQTVGIITNIETLSGDYLEDYVAKITIDGVDVLLAKSSSLFSFFDDRLELNELNTGDFVVVNTVEREDGALVARRLLVERETESGPLEVFGRAALIDENAGVFSVGNTQIQVNEKTRIVAKAGGAPLSVANVSGALVEVEGEYQNGMLIADTVEVFSGKSRRSSLPPF